MMKEDSAVGYEEGRKEGGWRLKRSLRFKQVSQFLKLPGIMGSIARPLSVN